MFNRLIRKTALGISLVVMLLFAGCDAPEVEIVVSSEFHDAMVQVDFVKVPRSQMTRWLNKDVDEYFSPNDSFRADAISRGDVYSVYYNMPNRNFIGVIRSDNAVWDRFQFDKGSSEQDFDILVIADLPGAFTGGAADVRREVIPLYKKAWSISFLEGLFGGGLDRLSITITKDGILLDPAPLGGNWP